MIQKAVHAQQSGNNAEQQDDRQVGGDKQHDAFHGNTPLKRFDSNCMGASAEIASALRRV